jgi:hypothetical protein
VGGGQQQFGARARGGAVGRWGWCGPTCRRGGSAGRKGKGQNHEVERYPYAFFRGRDLIPGPHQLFCWYRGTTRSPRARVLLFRISVLFKVCFKFLYITFVLWNYNLYIQIWYITFLWTIYAHITIFSNEQFIHIIFFYHNLCVAFSNENLCA